MRTFVIFLIILLISCTITFNKVEKDTLYNPIDPEFSLVLQSFMYEAEFRGHSVSLLNVNIQFANLRLKAEDTAIGYCYVSPLYGVFIKIHKPTWYEMSIHEREELMFHELGHCLMGREHCIKLNEYGPISIMHPLSLDADYYKSNREELVDELFNISPECVGNNNLTNEIDR